MRRRGLCMGVVMALLGLSTAWAGPPVVMAFDCDLEGFSIQQGDTFGGMIRHENGDGQGRMVLTHEAARQDPLDPSVDYSLIQRNLVVSTAEYDRVAMGLTIVGVEPEDTVPFVLVTYVDGDLVWHPNQRVHGGTSVFRFDPSTNPAWDGGTTNILRFDIARLGELPPYFDHSQVRYEIDWVAVYSEAENPGFVPTEQDTHPECLPVPVPDVTGLPEGEALAVLDAVGLVGGVRRVASEMAPEGFVVAQNPAAGALARPRGIVEVAVSQPYRQYRVAEFDFTAGQDHAGSASSVVFDVTFTGPEGTEFLVPGFWDGGLSWKARLNPLVPGEWTYATSAVGEVSLDGLSGTFTVLPAAGENPLYRHGGVLRVSEDRRYLTHDDGTPFYWLGDTWWFCPGTLVPFSGGSSPDIPSAFKHLVDHRRSQGFTVLQLAFLSSGTMLLQDTDPETSREMDYYLAYANDAGMVPAIAIAFHSGMDTLTLEQWKARWRYVIARAGAFNVTWIITGEYNANNGPLDERIPKVRDLGQYIKDTDPYHRAMSVHPWAQSVDSRDAWNWPWYDFIMFQGGHGGAPPLSVYQQGRDHPPTRPVLESECRYDHIRGFTDADVREVAWRAVQAGCFGYTYGAHGLWYPTQDEDDTQFEQDWGESPPWWEALLYPGGDQMGYLKRVYASVPWWRLAPRTGAASRSEVLVTSDGTAHYVVYFPRGLDPAAGVSLSGAAAGVRYRATWHDPRTGAATPLETALVNAAGILPLPARADSQDWVLTLRDLDTPVTVPDVVDMPRAEAVDSLRALGLGAVFTGYEGAGGFVAGQSPAAGESALPESTVTLTMVERAGGLSAFHAADTNEDGVLDVSEVLRVVQLYRWGGFQCEDGTVDGYGPGAGAVACAPHTADLDPADWRLDLSEVLRVLQLASHEAILPCEGTEDGFCGSEGA